MLYDFGMFIRLPIALNDRFRFLLGRLRERLWIKPLFACFFSVAGVLLAHLADELPLEGSLPEVSQDSVIEMLKIIAASMLGVATFAVASMVSAYASTGQMATARAFPLIVADDVSQNALSTFVAAFIFSIVGITAAMNDYYGQAGRFTLFILMALVLVIVVLTFVRWVDRIARLGRIGAIIGKVEEAAAGALSRRRRQPYMGGIPVSGPAVGTPVYPDKSGYLQHIDIGRLQRQAHKCGHRVRVDALPGAYVGPTRALCYLEALDPAAAPHAPEVLRDTRHAFTIGQHRQFDDDPRFGLLALSEIACRALSPGINDPGTAITVLGSMRRLFEDAARAAQDDAQQGKEGGPRCDRVAVPALELDTLFDDAFGAIARDGAGASEVVLRLLRHLGELGKHGPAMRACAQLHSDLALARAERALDFARDLRLVRERHAEYWSRGAADS